MAGLAGLAVDMFIRLVDAGLERKEEAEIDMCKRSLRKCKETLAKYKEAYHDVKEELIQSAQLNISLQSTMEIQKEQLKTLRKEKRDLFEKWTVSMVREATGGVASLEEYDAAMNDMAEDHFAQ